MGLDEGDFVAVTASLSEATVENENCWLLCHARLDHQKIGGAGAQRVHVSTGAAAKDHRGSP